MEGFLNIAWLVPVPTFLAFAAIILFLVKYRGRQWLKKWRSHV